MPVPTPDKKEDEQDFIERCMSDDVMKKEYEQKQRMAICQSKWEKHIEENKEIKDISKEKITELGTKIVKEIISRKKDGEMKFLISPEEGSEAYQKFWDQVKDNLTGEEEKWLTSTEATIKSQDSSDPAGLELNKYLDNPLLIRDSDDDELKHLHNKLSKEYKNEYPKDKESEINKITNKDIKEKFDIGLITLNEARKELGLEPVDDGNKLKSELPNTNKNPEQLEKDQIDTALKEKELKIQEKRQELLERLEDELNG